HTLLIPQERLALGVVASPLPSALVLPHPSTTALHTLSLHDALPIYHERHWRRPCGTRPGPADHRRGAGTGGPGAAGTQYQPVGRDRKSTRLNSSHVKISYAVFCLKKKKTTGGSATRSGGHYGAAEDA